MARLPRLTVPGYPHHIIQRGNNRQVTFHDAADHELMLQLLGDAAAREKVAVHGYVLMPNHLHLVVTPQTATGVPSMMQAVGRRYVQGYNRKYRRSGTLWEGRYRSTLIDTDSYLLASLVYLDLNPVRAGLVSKAADFPWSSYGHYAGIRSAPLITPHPLYWALGNTPFAREAAYVELVERGLGTRQQQELTDSVTKGWVLGSANFAEKLKKHTDRRLNPATPGRPRKKAHEL